jgi:putative PEP-CTERM system TPR-repeat lipoprotein
LARIDLKTGAVESAKKRYRDMLEMPEAGVRPLIDLAKIATEEGNLREAISLLSKAREQAPERVGVELDLIALLAWSGDGDSAIRNARKLYERFPDNTAVMEKVGHMEQAFGKIDEASKIFRRVAKSYSGSAGQLLRISEYQEHANDLAGAHDTLKRAHTADDKHLAVLERLIGLESRLALFDDALLRTRLLIKQSPDKALGYRLRGDVFTKLRKFADAAAAYSKAIKRDRSGALLVRRYIAQRAGGGKSSLRPLEEWVSKNPTDYPTRRTLASAYLDTGKKTKAVKIYEELAALRKNDPVVLNNLANLYFELGDARAMETADAAFKLAPKQPQTLDTLGWLLVQKGDVERGLELLRDAYARASRRPKVRYHLAVALSRLGKAAEAKEHLEAILTSERLSADLAAKTKRLLATLKDG